MELNEKGYPVWKNGNKTPLHRYQVEKQRGSKLSPNEEVHHLDGDKLNYDIDNLIVLSKEDHYKIQKVKLWKNENMIILYSTTIFLSCINLIFYLKTKNINLIYITFGLLLLGLIISTFPNFTRKLLFKLRVLKSNKK